MPRRSPIAILAFLCLLALHLPLGAVNFPHAAPAAPSIFDPPPPVHGALVVTPEAPLESIAAETPPMVFDDIAGEAYRGEFLPLILAELRTRAFSEVHQTTEKLQKILTEEELKNHLLRQTPEGGTAGEILDRALHTLRRQYSKEFRLYDMDKTNVLVAAIILLLCIGWYTLKASRGESLFIREIAGLASIDEAVGRCTEMGKPVLFVPGIYDMDDIQTISAISILGHVAKKTAEYETPVMVPCCRSLVMSTSFEVVKESYIQTGKADSFQPDNVRYLTDDQFGYVAGVDGIMLRDRPAANFFLGVFFAESLILAETGHSIGSIQIAGTASVHQIPFFITACDYTLIGEELFAASAYLSRDPMQLGSIKGQDMGKFIMMVLLVLGVALASFGPAWQEIIHSLLKAQ